LKVQLTAALKAAGYQVADFGAYELVTGDDYPDFVVPMARAVAGGEVTRGLAICGSGVGACVAGNKVPGVRAALITDSFSAHQGVEDDDMNVMCLGGRGHRTCFGVGFGSDVPKRPFQGGRAVYTPSCESGGIGKKGESLNRG